MFSWDNYSAVLKILFVSVENVNSRVSSTYELFLNTNGKIRGQGKLGVTEEHAGLFSPCPTVLNPLNVLLTWVIVALSLLPPPSPVLFRIEGPSK